MNALLGRQRAIVTDVAGTTRDYLEETCLIEGRSICLVDTAGLRDTDDQVEKLGVEQSMQLAENSDLALILVAANASEQEKKQSLSLHESIGSKKSFVVVSKADLDTSGWTRDYTFISCHEKGGLDDLRQKIVSFIDEKLNALGDEPFVTSDRQIYLLQQAKQFLSQFFEGIDSGQYEELLAFELQRASESLSEILGKIDNEDILDQVFGDFCLGK